VVANQNRSVEPDPVDDFQESMVALVRALGLHKPDATPCGQPISVGEVQALLEIAREPGISQNGLARHLQLDKSTVSRIVGMLERREWIERLRDKSDTRLYRLRLTRLGVKANNNLARSRREKFERVFSALPERKRNAVAASLSMLVEAIRES
jgi:DNA-binding MarR family transcriptional regulator